MVQRTVRMAKAEHQGELRTIADDADDGTVGRALPPHLHPSALPWHIPTVAPLGDHALKTRHKCQPFLGLLGSKAGHARDEQALVSVRRHYGKRYLRHRRGRGDKQRKRGARTSSRQRASSALPSPARCARLSGNRGQHRRCLGRDPLPR